MSGDTLLNYGAIAIESLILVALIIICIRSPAKRKRAIVVLGAITPMILFYMGAWIDFTRNPADPSAKFAFYAMWIMGFGLFVASTLAGALASLLPRPKSAWLRFVIGLSVGFAIGAAATGAFS